VSDTVEILLKKIREPGIELPTALGEIDLHNFADFHRLQYETDGHLSLMWLASTPREFNLGKRAIKQAVVKFREVSQLIITPRDPDTPRSEDRTLEEFELMEITGDHCHLAFTFLGGFKVDVTAAHVELLVDWEYPGPGKR